MNASTKDETNTGTPLNGVINLFKGLSKLQWLGVILALAVLIYLVRQIEPPIGDVIAAEDKDGNWGLMAQDDGGARFSSLTQINRENVHGLKIAWRHKVGEYVGNETDKFTHSFQLTPILEEERLYGCTQKHTAFALDARTGERVWSFSPDLNPSAQGATMLKCKGLAYWKDPNMDEGEVCSSRLIYGASLSVFALDAKTGALCPDFGQNGKAEVEVDGLEFHDEVQLRSPAVIVGDVAVFGTTLRDIYRIDSPSGAVRAFDVRTGEQRWEFDPIPRDPANPAYATWGGDSASYTGSANVWTAMSADPENDLVFLPTSSPAADFFGGHRPGTNEWSNSIVALRGSTGEFVWGYQVTRHDIWDSDLPAQPIAVDLTIDGELVPALVVMTKQSFVFVFNRLTGEPIHPIEGREVPTDTDVPGEWVSPTQPFPTVIPPLVKLGFDEDDLWGMPPSGKSECRKIAAQYRNDGFYTPPTLQGTIMRPGGAGGMNWSGGAIDASTNTLYVPVMDMPQVVKLNPRPDVGGDDVVQREGGGAEDAIWPMKGTPYTADLFFLSTSEGIPCSSPPWARILAVDLATGDVRWNETFGTIAGLKWYAPSFKWGAPFSGGPIATAGGVVFIAAASDSRFRAFDTETGEELWSDKLPAAGMAVPMTYAIDGKQYVVIAAGGSNIFPGAMSDDIIAYALPKDPK